MQWEAVSRPAEDIQSVWTHGKQSCRNTAKAHFRWKTKLQYSSEMKSATARGFHVPSLCGLSLLLGRSQDFSPLFNGSELNVF